MTDSMRARVKSAIETSNGGLTIEKAQAMIAQKESQIRFYNNLPSWKIGYSEKCAIAMAQADIEYFTAVIEVLTEQAEVAATEAVTETITVLAAIVTVANKAKAVRRAVATLANKLRKTGFTLSDAFRKAWALTKAFTGLLPSAA